MNFDWQTEEEREWEHPEQRVPEPAGRPRRRWLWILLSLALLVAAVFVTWRQVSERIDDATDVVKEDVLSSHALARRAAAQQDEELFVSILSGRSQRWTEAQKERLLDGLLFEESLRPFGFRPSGPPPADAEVTLNPELSEALVQTVQPFAVDAGGGLTATIHLTQTHVYRQGSQRWLLSPPEDAFWGAWQTVDGNLLTLVAPERDQELAARLAPDIDAKLGEMCREIVACPQGFHVRLRLEKDPSSVNEAAEPLRSLEEVQSLSLPAPTLLGLPADETAYEALYRAYARHVVAGALRSLTEYECCNGILFYHAIVQMQLAQLDLRSPPLEGREYRHLLDIPTSAQHLVRLWEEEELPAIEQSVPPEIYTLVEFLQQRSDGPAENLQRLQESFGSTFWDWIRNHQWGLEWTLFDERWNRFVHDSIREGQEASSQPQDLALPEQDLVAMCGDGPQHVYRYDLYAKHWSREVGTGFEYGFQRTLPGDDGYIVTGELLPDFGEDRFLTLLMRNGSGLVTLAGDGGPGPFLLPWGIVEPGSQRMVVWLFQNPSVAEFEPQVALLDPDTCDAQGCTFKVLPGMPVWSPDGSRKVTVDVVEGSTVYYEVDGEGQRQETSFSAWPFWLDNETFGVVRAGTTGREQQVRITNVTTGETSVLLTSQDALMSIPENRRPVDLRLVGVLRDPAHGGRIVAMASSSRFDGESFLLEIRRADQQSGWIGAQPEVRMLAAFRGIVTNEWFMTGFSLNDRWLNVEVQQQSADGPQGNGLVIYDLQEERLVLESPLAATDNVIGRAGDWSADGDWFARVLPRRIDLIAPGFAVDGHAARYVIFHDFRDCTSIGWVNR